MPDTYFFQLLPDAVPDGDLEIVIPRMFLDRSVEAKPGGLFASEGGLLFFEYVGDDVFVFVTDIGIVKETWREKFQKVDGEIRVWNSFSLRKNEIWRRPHYAAPRDSADEVEPSRRGVKKIEGSFDYLKYIRLEPGDLLEVNTGSGIESIPVWKG